ncbi:MAG: potassium transporter [Chloroflexaceae bacterium]|nr:potassium transporter [Chloroflexaceae bacterium]
MRWINIRPERIAGGVLGTVSRLYHYLTDWNDARRPMPPPLRIIGGLGFLVMVGTVLLMLPGVGAERPLTFNEALFTATSALSVTGLSIIVPSQDLTIYGQLLLLLLIQIGGVGFMVVAVVTFWILGRKVSLPQRLALSDSLGLLMPGAIISLTRRVMLTVLAIEAVGAVLLWLHWYDDLGPGRAVLYAVFHAVSAFCNAGFDLFSGLPEYPQGTPNDTGTMLILGGLIFLGGLGIPVLSDLLGWRGNHRLTLHTRITLIVVITLICAGGLGLFVAEHGENGVLYDEPWWRQLVLAFFQSISARTAGFAGIQPFDQITYASQLLLTVLMFIGAAPASMGGGITTGTFAVLVLTLWGYAQGLPSAQIGGRSIAPLMIRKASAVLTISLFVVLLASWLILLTHNVGIHLVVFEVISAFATCGLSLNFTGQLNPFGQYVIIFVMFWGRLGALTVVVALAQLRTHQLVEYPEENILIG